MPKVKKRDFFVYVHKKKTTGEVFYVGKGCGDRATDKKDRSEYWKRVERKHGRIIEYVVSSVQEWYAFEVERELIDYYGRRDLGHGNLCNMTDGGDGAAGQVMSAEAIRKGVEKRVGRISHFLGKTHTEATKEKMRKPKSEATKNKMRKPKSEAMRQKLSLAKQIPVKCSNGMIFASGFAAIDWLRANGKEKAASSAICKACRGELNHAYGFTWSYV